mmetsp:Transcript_37067/g.37733  ORF Transcript_37067/g.37733 Transcript_37067/m.37733 type:complete len:202 (+) Transcript_37067:91-696(+)
MAAKFIIRRSCIKSSPFYYSHARNINPCTFNFSLIEGNDTHFSLIQSRKYRISRREDNPLIFAGVGIAVGAVALQYGLKAYEEMKKKSPPDEASESDPSTPSENTSKTSTDKKEASDTEEFAAFSAYFNSFFVSSFYDGGFDEKMSRNEAALILGVREYSSTERIKEAHRKILVINHPDRGGSAYIAAKVNEAKDLLLKGR